MAAEAVITPPCFALGLFALMTFIAAAAPADMPEFGVPAGTPGANGTPGGDRTPPAGIIVGGAIGFAPGPPRFICTMSSGTLRDIIARAWYAFTGGAELYGEATATG